jgi:hypothetical protein
MREEVPISQLSDRDILRQAHGLRRVTEEQGQYFEYVVGSSALTYINSQNMPLWINRNRQQYPSKSSTCEGKVIKPRVLLELTGSYYYTSFATFTDQRVILLSAFVKKPLALAFWAPKKVIQIDFVYEEDWFSKVEANKCYERTTPLNKLNGQGLLSPALPFLRKIRGLVDVVDEGCIVQICTDEPKRESIYRKALGNQTNVRFRGNSGYDKAYGV